ncbi:MAG TPA: acyl carrier protein [Streptosporangiaceae bacterium]|nr:acyl carrier protein [Streptosporangiaceae bacterium]
MSEVNSLRSVVAGVFEVAAEEITDDLGPATFGRWGSLQHIQLVAAVEQAYGIHLSPREIRSFSTVAELNDIVASKGIAT